MVIMMGIVLIFMMMYRNPAVALMPDITPKPLRAKANGIINIMGYLGGGAATILGVFLKLSDYINVTDRSTKMWIIEIPFIVASLLMVISALVLFFTIRENKIEEEMKDELAEGERLAAIETPATDEGPMSPANRRMLLAILGAEFLWFMSDNAIGTYIGNYVIYYLNASSSATMILTLGGGLASAVGFLIAGGIAEKIGRKWTVSCGLLLSVLATLIMIFVHPTGVVGEARGVHLPADPLWRLGAEGLRHGAGAQLLLPDGGGAVLLEEDRQVHRLLLRGQHVRADGHAHPAGLRVQRDRARGARCRSTP